MKLQMRTVLVMLIAAAVLTSGLFVTSTKKPATETAPVSGPVQTVEILAKGGYSPALSSMKAGMPGLLRVTTRNTFDCSAALVIPQLGYSARLPLAGTVEIPVPPQPAGTTLTGMCSMGMYSFAIRFL